MPRRKSHSLPALTERGRQIISHLVNAVAFKVHGDQGELETLAQALGTTGPRLRPMLRKLQAQGWLTLEEKSLTFAYPTAAALRWVDPELTPAEANKLLGQLYSPCIKRK